MTRNIVLTTFCAIFLLLLPVTFFGFDITDQGYHLSNQVLAYQMGIQYLNTKMSMWWLTDIIAGWWLHLTNSLGLWGARLGGVLLYACAGSLAVYTVSRVYKPSWLMFFAMLSILFYAASPFLHIDGPYMHYYTLPMLFGLIVGLFFIESILNPNNILYPILTGISILLLIFSRFPSIIIIFLPMFFILAAYILKMDNIKSIIKPIKHMYIVILIGLSLYFYFLWRFGFIKTLIGVNSVSLESIFLPYLKVIYGQLTIVSFLFISPLIIRCFFKKARPSIKNLISIIIFFILLIFVYLSRFTLILYLSKILHFPYQKILLLYYRLQYYFFPDLLLLILMILAAIFFIHRIVKNRKHNQLTQLALFCIAIILPFILGVGSACGPIKFIYGIWYLGILTPVYIEEYYQLIAKLKLFNISFLICIGLMGCIAFYTSNFYRDSNILKLTSTMQSEKLKYIHTTYGRAKSFDALIRQVKKYVKAGDAIFAYNSIPMVYFVTQTKPLYNYSWIMLLNGDSLNNLRNTICKVNNPRIIIRALTNTRNFNWGTNGIYSYDNDSDVKLLSTIDNAIEKNCRPRLVWENTDFEILIPEK